MTSSGCAAQCRAIVCPYRELVGGLERFYDLRIAL
jgi:hypothetical protein